MLYSFIFFLIVFVAVGLASAKYSQKTTEDYLLASKSIKPWLAGFSLFATENSGFMFVGLIGLTYTIGLSALWVPVGWYIGEVLVWWLSARQIRAHNDHIKSQTYCGLLSRWTGTEYKYVRWIAAVITIMFLSVYAAAQLTAGGKALNVLVGWDVNTGAIIGFFMVLVYCVAGGIRATIWTDAVQALAMFGSLILIVAYSLVELGGLSAMTDQLRATDPELINLFAGSYKFGIIGFALGWLFGGMGVMGQPHVMVRFMVLDHSDSARTAALYYAGFVSLLTVLCTLAALAARVLLPELINSDPELALPTISANLMPGVLSGLFLAGLFAATMSTADSQVLASSAALTRDLTTKHQDNVLWAKAGTVLVALLALVVALSGNQSVLKLTLYGWSVMASSMGPLLFVYAMGKKPTQAHAIAMMLIGAGVSISWEEAGLSGDIYNVLPGIITALLVYFIPAPFLYKKA
ncbi:MAG: sodium/proline symporter [Alphaproteobacteria bacterium]|nr:sodium/proline symporter [Alphaproteobacteria bacterium]